MAKKQKTTPAPAPAASPAPPTAAAPTAAAGTAPRKWSVYDFKLQAIILGILALIFYANSFFNAYAHDDGIVIVKNEYVQEGFAGIPSILTKDAYDSYYRQLNTSNQLSGGRYRPLSIVTFAIEQQFFGAVPADKVDSILRQNISFGVKGRQQEQLVHQMQIRHVFNVLWYILSVIVMLYFLRYVVFRSNPLMAFIAAIIFTIHPIHTEVVANVKSRDEIMSLLFMCLTFIYEFRYREYKKPWMLLAALVCYFLAFLSKEYAITMVILLPLSLYLFNGDTVKKSLVSLLPYIGVVVIYLCIRFSIVAPMGENSETEVLNNPYVFASGAEKLATEIATSLNYLKLLLWPNPLSADYSYDTIPYKDWSDPVVWLSLLVHVGMVVAALMLLVKGATVRAANGRVARQARTILLSDALIFAVAFYLLHLAMVCNIFFDIGATMGERLIYHSSLGFAIAVAYFLVRAVEKARDHAMAQKALAGFMVVVIILAGYKTIARNADWKNDNVLFAADLKTVPNSVLVLGNVAASYITLADDSTLTKAQHDQYLYDAIKLLDHATAIHRKFVAGLLNRGIAWYKLGDMDKAKINLDSARALYPTYPTLPGIYKLISDDYMKQGWTKYGSKGMYPEAIAVFKKGIALDSFNTDLWYNLGGAYFSNKQYPEAIAAWQMSLKIKPDNQQAKQGLQAAMSITGGAQQQQQLQQQQQQQRK